MPRKARCRSFDFYPDDFLNDPAVLVMTAEQVGVYIRLLCSLWSLSEPGVAPDSDSVLQALARASSDEWERSKTAVSACFAVRRGKWVQQRMVQVFESQSQRLLRRSKAGIKGNQVRHGQQDNSHCDPIAVPSSSTASSSSSVKQPQNTRPPKGEQVSGEFMRFYRNYPRPTNRRAAAKAYAGAMARHPTMEHADLYWAMERYTLKINELGTQEKHIPHPSSWLNADGFLDFLETEDEAPQ